MKMTPTKIAEIKRKKEEREKGRPGRLLRPGVAGEKPFQNVQEMKDKFRSEKFRSTKNKGVDPKTTKAYQNLRGGGVAEAAAKLRAQGLMGGGMAMPRAMYGKGGGVCKRGMGRAYGKNS